jgi:hypothetical protein
MLRKLQQLFFVIFISHLSRIGCQQGNNLQFGVGFDFLNELILQSNFINEKIPTPVVLVSQLPLNLNGIKLTINNFTLTNLTLNPTNTSI